MSLKTIFQSVRDWFKTHFQKLPEQEQHIIDTAISVVNGIKQAVNLLQTGAEITPTDFDDKLAIGVGTAVDATLKELFTLQGQTPQQRFMEAIKLIMSLTKDHRAAIYLQLAALLISRLSATTGDQVKPSEAVSIAHERYQDITCGA